MIGFSFFKVIIRISHENFKLANAVIFELDFLSIIGMHNSKRNTRHKAKLGFFEIKTHKYL